eukprot:811857-Rhodomonas_salina.1
MPLASIKRNCIMSSTADVFFVSGAAIRRLSTAIRRIVLAQNSSTAAVPTDCSTTLRPPHQYQ